MSRETDLLLENKSLTDLIKRLISDNAELRKRLTVGDSFFIDTDWCRGAFYYCAEDNSAYIIANVDGTVRFSRLKAIKSGEDVDLSPIITNFSPSEQPTNKSRKKFSQRLQKFFHHKGA